ncbi:MAG: OprO/OprP family phosphate-selective porin [Methylobacillus sp.]|jgi:phosphate-selective porin OprO/OprP|nr:OprO/OprP family phosphate-selective porin [Methylobacillus sp.]
MKGFKVRGIVAAMMLGVAAPALADSTDDIINTLIAKGVLTPEEGDQLKNRREGEAKEAKKNEIKTSFKDGLVFESGDKSFSLAITGRVHADYRTYDYDNGKNNAAPVGAGNSIGNVSDRSDTFDIRRARIGLKTKFKEYYEAELSADIKTGNNTSVNDTAWDVAYFNVAWWKEAQFRFGLFKMPMNLEELTSSNNIDFMERSYVNQISPTKELGVMLHGTPFTGVTYALAASNGNGKNVETDMREDGKDVIGRITANFAEMMDNKDMVLHLGASYSQGDQPQGTIGMSGRTEARGATFFRAPVLANNPFKSIDRDRVGLEGVIAYGPFKVQSEWMKLGTDFKTNTRNYNLDIKNWYAEALWTITGESYADIYKNGAFGGIKPKNDFDPKTFKGGAWEIGLRYSEFDASDFDTTGIAIGSVADASITTTAAGFSKAKAYTAGIKFLPNANLRFMLNYVKTDFKDRIGGDTGGIIINNKREDSEDALIMRAQWMF